MAGHAVEAKQSGAELRPGQSHQLHAEALARADFVLAGTGGASYMMPTFPTA